MQLMNMGPRRMADISYPSRPDFGQDIVTMFADREYYFLGGADGGLRST